MIWLSLSVVAFAFLGTATYAVVSEKLDWFANVFASCVVGLMALYVILGFVYAINL